jgi:hypothetical protein
MAAGLLLLLLLGILLLLLAMDEAMTCVSLSMFPRYRPNPKAQRNVPLQEAKIAIVSLHGGFKYYGNVGRFFQNNKQSYADAHGYAYVDQFPPENLLVPLQPWQQQEQEKHRDLLYYQKPRFLLYLMETYNQLEWLLWIDGDAMFTHHNIRIEDRICQEYQDLHQKSKQQKTAEEKDLYLCLVWAKDNSMPNAGVMLLHNSAVTRQLLRTSLGGTFEDNDFVRNVTDGQAPLLTTAVQQNKTYQNCQLLLEQEDNSTLLQSRVRGGPSSGLGSRVIGYCICPITTVLNSSFLYKVSLNNYSIYHYPSFHP